MSEQEKTDGAREKNGVGPMSPYYLHPSDNPGQVFVSELLSDTNYGEWVNDMSNALYAKNKFGFVDGSIPMPAADSADLGHWMRCNAMVKGWLKSSIDKDVRSGVRYAKTAQEIWVDLEERYGKGSAPRLYELRRAVALLRKENQTVPAYYNKLKGLWDEMMTIAPWPKCLCGGCKCDLQRQLVEMKERDQLYDFLMGLDDTFGVVKSQILGTNPTPKLGSAYHLVAEDEQQRQISAVTKPTIEAAAFQVQGTRTYSDQKDRKRDKPKCDHCQKIGHTEEQCYELIGYPSDWKKGGRDRREKNYKSGERRSNPRAAQVSHGSDTGPSMTLDLYDRLMKYLSQEEEQGQTNRQPVANMAGKIVYNRPWIIDSGATDHITCSRELIEEEKGAGNQLPVQIPNGQNLAVKSIGKANLPNGLRINKVLYIPDFKCNLLSVSKLTKENNCVIMFFERGCLIQDSCTRSLIGVGRLCDGLYILDFVGSRQVCLAHQQIEPEVWHQRLGHAPAEKIKQVDLISSSDDKEFGHCDSCLRAKQTMLPFSRSEIKSTSCFDLIHCDIWGGYKVASLSGAHYFLTIVDDYSRATWVYLLAHKSDVGYYLRSFVNMVETQFNKKVKQVRTDNGLEFQSKEMMNFYNEKGIILQTTCPYTPQQNGVVERKHRYILEMARALRFHAGLPLKFWGECVLTAVYIINRLPTRVTGHKTPYELLLGKKPKYDHMRVFGCKAYMHNKRRQDKFDERGKPCIFIGYPMTQKGYRLYDLQSGEIHVSRDVIFLEETYPFQQDVVTQRKMGKIQVNDNAPIYNDHEENSYQIYPPEDTPSAEISDSINECPQQGESGTLIRRSRRAKHAPTHLADYDIELPNSLVHSQSTIPSGTSTVHPLSNYIVNTRFSSSHSAFLAAITLHDEPKSFAEACKHECWREAMKREIAALEANNTWTLESLPPGKKVIDAKWVFKTKFKPNGELALHKARLVARGFTQEEGVDFHETFAPVAKMVTVRTLLAVAAKRGWHVHQLDVNNAFLHGDLNEEVYMRIPPGFAKKGETRVCRLHKSLYGLRQASRNWYHKLSKTLVELGFIQSKADHSLFIYNKGSLSLHALVYVDDVLLAGTDINKMQEVKSHLHEKFSIKDLGNLKYFLGIEVARSPHGFVLSQRKYALDILKEMGMTGCRPSKFPMEQNHRLCIDDNDPPVDEGRYRRLVGRLSYLTVTRPDLVYAVNTLCQFSSSPRQSHMQAAERIVRYLKATLGQGILLNTTNQLQLTSYCDADWGGCQMTRRSCTGYLTMLGGSPVSWRSKRQTVVARSSAEAEYRAMASTVSEIIWLRWLLAELGVHQQTATPLYCDNQAALHIAMNPVFHERTKHVEMDCYFVRERVQSQEIQPLKIRSGAQLADMFTKALGQERLLKLCSKLGTVNLHAPPT